MRCCVGAAGSTEENRKTNCFHVEPESFMRRQNDLQRTDRFFLVQQTTPHPRSCQWCVRKPTNAMTQVWLTLGQHAAHESFSCSVAHGMPSNRQQTCIHFHMLVWLMNSMALVHRTDVSDLIEELTMASGVATARLKVCMI